MNRTRVLGIAPYEGMKNLMLQLAAKMDDIELTAFVGDLEPGVTIAEEYATGDFDVILSRGGTAEMIRQKTRLPVVDIELSVYDILRSIRLAESGNNHYAIVGFPAITRNVSFLCEVLRYNIDLYTIHNEEEARKALNSLAQQGCSMVLCDMITSSLAREYGLPAILIVSGSESVEAALRQAVAISRVFQPLQKHSAFLDKILRSLDKNIVVMDEHGNSVYSTLSTPLWVEIEKRIRNCLPVVLEEGGKRSLVSAGGRQYMLRGRLITCENARYAMFDVSENLVHPKMEKYGIRYLDKEEVFDHFFNSFYSVTQPATTGLYEQYAQSPVPLMIAGELGTGKNHMSHLLYRKGRFQNAPLCVVDCALLKKQGWSCLMDSEHTPLSETGITMYFRNVEELEEAAFLQLFLTLRDTHFHQRNKLLFSCTVGPDGALSARAQQILSWFSCIVLTLPALRAHRQDIPQLASLYISILNMRNAKEVAGIETDGLTMLEEYDWPANYDQFKRVLYELILQTNTTYIPAESVKRVLKQERSLFARPTSSTLEEFLGGKTLEEISMLVIRHTLARERGNQTVAAARLGISRTTLWRMLQKEESIRDGAAYTLSSFRKNGHEST